MDKNFPIALVTGAAHHLGKTFALALAQQGYAIVLHYHSSNALARSTTDEFRALGVPVFPCQADLTDEKQVARLFAVVDEAVRQLSAPLKVLVNSAALMARGNLRTLPAADFEAVLRLNLQAPFLCSQQAFARMDTGGLIVNVSDVAAQKTWSAYPVYTVSKAGLESLTKVMARSFAPTVRVNGIAPGLALASEDFPPDDWQRLVNRLPIKRAAFMDELADALEFLLKNEYVTGQTIVVDGGYSLL